MTRAQQIAAIRARAVNDTTREIARRGITLTDAEADSLGDDVLGWLSHRLGMSIHHTDRGVVCLPDVRP